MVVAACSLFVVTSAAHAARHRHSTAARPQVAAPDLNEARRIVKSLWEEHNGVLKLSEVNAIEWGAARSYDAAYVTGVWCGCEPARHPTFAARVIPQVPRSSPQNAFIAQVRETDSMTHESAWHIVAVASISGRWKLTFVASAGSSAEPPLKELGRANAATGRVTPRTAVRVAHLADAAVRYAMAHNKLTVRTTYGATIRRRFTVRPKIDGIYGLALPNGKVLACFTLHSLDTYSMSSGLRQGPLRHEWGHLLAPGVYRHITADTARPMCVEGAGVGSDGGVFRAGDEQRIVAMHGTRR